MTDTPSAADLIEQAQAAQTIEELDAIAAQSGGRVTVDAAVDQRRQELTAEQQANQPGGEPAGELAYGGGEGEAGPFGTPGEAAPGTDNPGDIEDPKGIYTPEQVDPPLGPYPDPPPGPYPDPVIKDDTTETPAAEEPPA